MRKITFIHLLVLFTTLFAISCYQNYQLRQEILGLRESVNNQNYLNSVLVEQVAEMSTQIGQLKIQLFTGEIVTAALWYFINTKVDDVANNCLNDLMCVWLTERSSVPQTPSDSPVDLSLICDPIIDDAAITPEDMSISNSEEITPDATEFAANICFGYTSMLSELNGGFPIPQCYYQRNVYARHNVFWP